MLTFNRFATPILDNTTYKKFVLGLEIKRVTYNNNKAISL